MTHPRRPSNLLDGDRLTEWRREAPEGTLVLATGCFDILHVGHLAFLSEAREQGDVLVVGLNADASVAAIKGPERPFVPQDERAALVCALRPVDYAFLFDDIVCDRWIAALRPDVLVLGEESVAAYPSEPAAARECGARVHAVGKVAGRSTTSIAAMMALRHDVT